MLLTLNQLTDNSIIPYNKKGFSDQLTTINNNMLRNQRVHMAYDK